MNPFKMNDLKLIELVKQNRQLYDKSHAEYRDMAKKSITWKAIGVALATSGDICRKRFRNLRDRFAKEKKARKSDMLANPNLPVIYKKMMFLWDHLLHRNEFNYPEIEEVVTPEIQDEVHKQIQILKECEETEESSVENNVCDIQEEIVVICNRTSDEYIPHETEIETYVEEAKENSVTDTSDEQMGETFEQNEVNSAIDQAGSGSKTTGIPETNSAYEQQNKKRKITGEINQPSKTLLLLPKFPPKMPKPNSNELFCAMAKQYLDEINSREKLSKTRLQIMTILHNELYSTYK